MVYELDSYVLVQLMRSVKERDAQPKPKTKKRRKLTRMERIHAWGSPAGEVAMGLDMYLERQIYVGGHYAHRNVGGTINLQLDNTPLLIPGNRVSEIRLHEGYWRKANAIHRWFVNTCAGGRDECQEIEVSREQLFKLKALCQQALHAPEHAHDLLPTQSGFFFGSTTYGEDYLQDLRDTIEIIDKATSEDFASDIFIYQASW